MKAVEIRAEIEKLAAEGAIRPEDWLRLQQAWQAIKPETDTRYHPIIDDRLRAYESPEAIALLEQLHQQVR